MYYEHGDVTIRKIDTLPENVKAIMAKNGFFVLAEGETTGHMHRIAQRESVEMMEAQGRVFLRVAQPVDLVHEEHKTMTIDPGIYEIDRVKEYDPFAEEIRRVQD